MACRRNHRVVERSRDHSERVSNIPSTIVEISKEFTRETRKGNINSAMKLLADNMQNGILPLNDQTLYQIKQKHPHGKDAHPEVLLPDIPYQIPFD